MTSAARHPAGEPDGQRGDSSPSPDPSTKEAFALMLRSARSKDEELFALRFIDGHGALLAERKALQARVEKLEALAERRRRGYMSAVEERNIAEARVEELERALRELCDEAQQIVSMALSGRDSRPDGRSVVSDETLDAARAVLLSDRKEQK